MAQTVVISTSMGERLSGFSCFGPFPSGMAAQAWAKKHLSKDAWWIAEMYQTSFFDKCKCGDIQSAHEGAGFNGEPLGGRCAYCPCEAWQPEE